MNIIKVSSLVVIYQMKNTVSFLLATVLFLCSCSTQKDKISTVKEFNSWMNEEENGMQITKSVNGVSVTVSYFPPAYSALKEMESTGLKDKQQYDSLLNYYQSSALFVMTISPDDNKDYKGDIMYKDVTDFKAYVERALELNFNLESYVALEVDGEKYVPVLSSMDNTYSLTDYRKINFVFVPTTKANELQSAQLYQFVYHDEIFKLGTLYFPFDKVAIENNMPEISLL
jgi:hypothetical protein